MLKPEKSQASWDTWSLLLEVRNTQARKPPTSDPWALVGDCAWRPRKASPRDTQLVQGSTDWGPRSFWLPIQVILGSSCRRGGVSPSDAVLCMFLNDPSNC